jgi:hypothetical protein
VTGDEYQQIVASANPKTVSEWARAILVHASEPVDIEFLLLAEFLALRTIVLNLHFSQVEGGRNPSLDGMKALIDRADSERLHRAKMRIAELGAAAHMVSRRPAADERS